MPVPHATFQVLSAADVIAELSALRARQPVKYSAFYSSQLGGVVTDPALMVIPFDDHMVHRGHGIFDTAGLVDGKIYDLEAHLDRFLRSAERSKLQLPGSRELPGHTGLHTQGGLEAEQHRDARDAPAAAGCVLGDRRVRTVSSSDQGSGVQGTGIQPNVRVMTNLRVGSRCSSDP